MYTGNWGRSKALKLTVSSAAAPAKQYLAETEPQQTRVGTLWRHRPSPSDFPPPPLQLDLHDHDYHSSPPRLLELSHGSNDEKKWLVVTLNNCLFYFTSQQSQHSLLQPPVAPRELFYRFEIPIPPHLAIDCDLVPPTSPDLS